MKYYHIVVVMILLIVSGSASIPPEVSIRQDKTLEEMPNVILMIGDGMGPEEVKLASLVEYGSEKLTIMDTDFPVKFKYNTTNIDAQLTDSAAAGTAIATGQLTTNSRISMDKDATHNYKTILEYLRDDFGYATGIVTTTEVAHATPAVFASHDDKRSHAQDIFDELIKSKLDVYMGGGLNASYLNSGDISFARDIGSKNGFEVAVNRDELLDLTGTADRLFGVFKSEGTDVPNMPFELDRNPEVEPSIVEMASSAVGVLDRKDSPFFLMIEGGRIDHAGHRLFNTPETALDKTIKNAMETIMFEKAVRAVLDYAKNDGNTIVVVAADHETGGLQVHDYSGLNSTLPSDSMDRDSKNALRVDRISSINASWSTTGHTNTPVTFYGYGSDFGGYEVKHVDDVFWAINTALGNFPTVPDYLYDFSVDSEVKVELTIRDLDKTVSGAIVRVQYTDNSTLKEFQFDFSMDETSVQKVFTVPLAGTQSYFINVLVIDQGVNDVMTFSHKDTLKRQDVSYISTSEVITSSESITDESSTSEKTPLVLPVGILGVILLAYQLIRKRRT